MKGSLILTPYFKHTYAVCIGCRSCDVCKSLLDESGNLFWRPTPNTYARYIRCPSHGVLKTVLGESANLSWHPIPNTQMLKHQMSIARGLQTQSRRVSQNVTHEWRAFLFWAFLFWHPIPNTHMLFTSGVDRAAPARPSRRVSQDWSQVARGGVVSARCQPKTPHPRAHRCGRGNHSQNAANCCVYYGNSSYTQILRNFLITSTSNQKYFTQELTDLIKMESLKRYEAATICRPPKNIGLFRKRAL